MMSLFWQSLRQAHRGLLRSPGYAAAAIFTLALGIGANAAIFSVASTLLLRPLPFPHSETIYRLINTHVGTDGVEAEYQAGPREYLAWRAEARTLSAVEVMRPRELALSGEGEPETIEGASASAGLLRLLGARMLIGRDFAAEEDAPGIHVAVLSHGLWQRRFGGDRTVVGRSIMIDGESHVVIGVLSPTFKPLIARSDLWVPLGWDPANPPTPQSRYLDVIGRARPGMTPAMVTAELEAIGQQLAKQYPMSHAAWSARAKPLQETLVGNQRPALLMLLAAVALLLLLGCANVANLTLARVVKRRGETALRLALGANRWQLAERQIAESLLIGIAGGVLGLLLAHGALRPLLALDPNPTPLLQGVTIDGRVLAFTAVVSLLAGFVCGALPGLRGTRPAVTSVLGEMSRRSSGSARDRRVRRTLVVAQTALALVLLSGAALMIRSFERLGDVNPGFDPRNVLTFQVTLPAAKYPATPERAAFLDRALEAVRAVPGVQAAGTTMNRFQADGSIQTVLYVEGRPIEPGTEFPTHFRRVSAGYLETMRIPLLRGRLIEASDKQGSLPIAVIDRSFAERHFSGQDPIGKRIKRPGDTNPWLTVVGIVGDVHDSGLADAIGPTLYLPYAQNSFPLVSFVVRATSSPAQLAGPLRDAIWSVDPNLPLDDIVPLEQLLDVSLSAPRFRTVLLFIFAVVGLVIASLGVYAVTAHSVAERTREVGIRMALGASGGSVVRLLVLDAMTWIAVGLATGVLAALAMGSAIRGLLYDATGADAESLAAVSALLALVALVAAYLPVRKAASLAPTSALAAD